MKCHEIVMNLLAKQTNWQFNKICGQIDGAACQKFGVKVHHCKIYLNPEMHFFGKAVSLVDWKIKGTGVQRVFDTAPRHLDVLAAQPSKGHHCADIYAKEELLLRTKIGGSYLLFLAHRGVAGNQEQALVN